MFDFLLKKLDFLLGLSITKLSLFNILMRAFIGYIFGIIIILLNRHFMIEHSSFDIVIRLMIGTTLAGAMIGVSPYFETLAMIAFLVFLNWMLSLLSFHSRFIDKLFSGEKQILFHKNRIHWTTMRGNFITKIDLLRSLREKGFKSLDQVETVYIERDGEISIIPKA